MAQQQQQQQQQRSMMPRWDVPDVGTWQGIKMIAEDLFNSGLLPPHVKSPQAALLIVQKGRELGLPPTYALCNLYVLNGKVGAPAEVMLALIYRDHGDNALIVEHTDATRCVIRYKRRGWHDYKQFEYTIEEAKRAGLLQREVWQRHPAAMLRARAISAVARFAFPDSISGMYTPDELDEVEQITAAEQRIASEYQAHPVATEDAWEPEEPQPGEEDMFEADFVEEEPEDVMPAAKQQAQQVKVHAEVPAATDVQGNDAQGNVARQAAPQPGTEAAAQARLERRAKAVEGALQRLHEQTGISIDWMMKWLKDKYNITHLGEVTNEILLELRKEAEEARLYLGVIGR